MTALADRLSQLDGLTRTAGLLHEEEEGGMTLTAELQQALATSQAEVTCAQAAVEACLQRMNEIACPGPPQMDGKLRDGLLRHGRKLLEDIKPRLSAATRASRGLGIDSESRSQSLS